MKAKTKAFKTVIVKEGGMHNYWSDDFKVLVFPSEERGGENDPVAQYLPADDEGDDGGGWFVWREFDLDVPDGKPLASVVEANPLVMAPVAESFGFHGYARQMERISTHILCLHLRMYTAIREALGISSAQDGYRWQAFRPDELPLPVTPDPPIYDTFCTLVGQAFGQESEAAQREALRKSP